MREVGDQILFLHRLQPGGADRSYGIEVGRLAGLPQPVIGRARTILALLEGEHLARGERAAPSSDDAAERAIAISSACSPRRRIRSSSGWRRSTSTCDDAARRADDARASCRGRPGVAVQ